MTPAFLITDGKQVSTLTASAPGVWVTNCGTLWLDAAATSPYTGASISTVYFKAKNKTSSGTVNCGSESATISIMGVFPGIPHYGYEFQPDIRGVVTAVSRSGRITGRILGDGILKLDYKLVMKNNKPSQYEEVEKFWGDHYPHLDFKYEDKLRNIVKFLRFNSRIKVIVQSHVRIDYEVEATEV